MRLGWLPCAALVRSAIFAETRSKIPGQTTNGFSFIIVRKLPDVIMISFD